MERRSDQVSAMLLDAALDAAQKHGTLPPVSELVRIGIAMDTAVRIRTQPDNRRYRAER